MSVTSPQAAAHFFLLPMLPSFNGHPRSGIVSTAVYADPGVARAMISQILEHVRPGTMVLPLVVVPLPARGPSATLSGITGYRITSRGARTTANVATQMAELNAVAQSLAREQQWELLSA